MAMQREEKASEVASLAAAIGEADGARAAAETRVGRLEALLAAAQDEMRSLQVHHLPRSPLP